MCVVVASFTFEPISFGCTLLLGSGLILRQFSVWIQKITRMSWQGACWNPHVPCELRLPCGVDSCINIPTHQGVNYVLKNRHELWLNVRTRCYAFFSLWHKQRVMLWIHFKGRTFFMYFLGSYSFIGLECFAFARTFCFTYVLPSVGRWLDWSLSSWLMMHGGK